MSWFKTLESVQMSVISKTLRLIWLMILLAAERLITCPQFMAFIYKILYKNIESQFIYIILLVFVCITAYEVRGWTEAASGASGWFDVSCAQTEAKKSKSLTQRVPCTNKPLCRTTKSCPISTIINFISTVQASCIRKIKIVCSSNKFDMSRHVKTMSRGTAVET